MVQDQRREAEAEGCGPPLGGLGTYRFLHYICSGTRYVFVHNPRGPRAMLAEEMSKSLLNGTVAAPQRCSHGQQWGHQPPTDRHQT